MLVFWGVSTRNRNHCEGPGEMGELIDTPPGAEKLKGSRRNFWDPIGALCKAKI